MERGTTVYFLVLLFCRKTFCEHRVNPVELEVKKLYIDVMNDMKLKFQNGDLNSEQKIGATDVIVETQALLGKFSLQVLGLDVGQRTSVEIFETLKAFKEAGNMTEEQDRAMLDLAEDTQVRMIQGILKVFGYIPERASMKYNVPLRELRLLLQRPTFQSDSAEERKIEQELEELVTDYPPIYEGQSSTEDTLLESLSIKSVIGEEAGSIVCESEHEKCSDSACIPSRWWCDGDEDCADGSDESDCSELGARRQQCDPDNHRQCENGDCLPKEVWCDGHTDCLDGSDEGLECPKLNCSEVRWGTQWRCRDNKRCVLERWLCDGMEDCIDGSDEKGCQARLLCDLETDFECKDGSKCVRKDWLCDNFPDCGDGSDELNCKAESEKSNQRQSRKVENVTSEYELTTRSELTAMQTFNFDSKENDGVQMEEDTEQIWIIVLVFSLSSASTVALLSILIKCKWDKRGGRGGVWLTWRRFRAEGGRDDRIELCQA